jgi:hypothetical protein
MSEDAAGNGGAQQSATGRNIENRVEAALVASPSATNRLTQSQQLAMEMMLRGCSDIDVARQLDVDRGTVYRWRTSHPAFCRELQRLRDVIWKQQAERMRAMVQPALDVLEKQLENPTTALRAATVLLRFAAPRPPAPDAPPARPDAETLARIERRAFNRALDAFINAPLPDGRRGAEVHLNPDDDGDLGEEDLDDEEEEDGEQT